MIDQAETTNRRAGFTLVELLAVVAIIVLLLAIVLPSTGGASDAAQRVICLNNLRHLMLANRQYALDHKQTYCATNAYLTTDWSGYPTITTIPQKSILVLDGYMEAEPARKIFMCPADEGLRDEYTAGSYIRPPSFSYTRNAMVGHSPKSDSIRLPGKTAMLMEEWEFSPMNDGYVIANTWDLMTQRHNGNCGIGFFDDHVQMIDSITYNEQTPLWRLDNYLDPLHY